VSARDLITDPSKNGGPVITFCKDLDILLGGGVQMGAITEFCGVPGKIEINTASYRLIAGNMLASILMHCRYREDSAGHSTSPRCADPRVV
jgi:hypothetical protein